MAFVRLVYRKLGTLFFSAFVAREGGRPGDLNNDGWTVLLRSKPFGGDVRLAADGMKKWRHQAFCQRRNC